MGKTLRFDLLAEDCRRHTDGAVIEGANLRRYGRWHIGGPARILVEPASAGGVRELITYLSGVDCPKVLIGDGSNILFDDLGFDGIVIRIGAGLSQLRIEGLRVIAGAGLWMPKLARAVANAGLGGLEHTIGIPGTVGGLIAMNGGSQRRNIGERVARIDCLDWHGTPLTLRTEECGFGYRRSVLQDGNLILLSAEMILQHDDPGKIRREMIGIMSDRRRRFPKKLPNCGSVFLSDPVNYRRHGSPGQLIETADLKGVRIGDAQISPQHANFIVNLGNATSRDVLELIRLAQHRVFERAGVRLECEIRHIAPDGRIVPAHLAGGTNL